MVFDTKQLFSKIFMWLCLGLVITFGVGYVVQSNENIIYNLFSGGKYIIIWIAEIAVALFLGFRIRKMSTTTATILYLLYTALTGLTFSTIFIAYELTSIIWVFAVTAIVLFLFGLIGYKTNLDLTKIGTFLLIGLLSLIVLIIVSLFLDSETFNLGITILSLFIFVGYIAYDVQVIKKQLYGIDNLENFAIYGAFQLYLDFINIFLDLLRLFGKERQ